MKTVIYNYNESNIKQETESISLRAAYLLGFSVKTAGTLWFNIFFEEYFNSFSFKHRILFLKEHAQDEEEKKVYQTLFDSYKSSKKIKHKTHQILAAEKKLEIVVNKNFEYFINFVCEQSSAQVYTGLKKIMEEDVFDLYKMSPDTAEDGKDDHVPASQLFLRIFPGFEEDKGLFFLPPDFFKEHLSKKLNYFSASDRNALNPQHTYLESCFNLFDLRVITCPELAVVRLQLKDAASSFLNIMDEWVNMCSFSNDVEQRLSFFKENVLNEAISFSKAIQENDLVKQYHSLQSKDMAVQVLIGEMPATVLWEYYRHWGAITNETWEKIMVASENNDRYDVRWPVMVLKVDMDIITGEENKDAFEALFQQGKKSILID